MFGQAANFRIADQPGVIVVARIEMPSTPLLQLARCTRARLLTEKGLVYQPEGREPESPGRV